MGGKRLLKLPRGIEKKNVLIYTSSTICRASFRAKLQEDIGGKERKKKRKKKTSCLTYSVQKHPDRRRKKAAVRKNEI